jgi:hypothetical protein
MFSASIRDYRHYLSSTPVPPDCPQIKVELDRVIEANRAKLKGRFHAIFLASVCHAQMSVVICLYRPLILPLEETAPHSSLHLYVHTSNSDLTSLSNSSHSILPLFQARKLSTRHIKPMKPEETVIIITKIVFNPCHPVHVCPALLSDPTYI